MSNPAPSPSWMQLQVHRLQYILSSYPNSYPKGHHGVSTASRVPAFPKAPEVLPWGCGVQGQGQGVWGVVLGPPPPSPLSPTARGCQLSQRLAKVPLHPSAPLLQSATSVVPGTLSQGDAHPGGSRKAWQRRLPSSSSNEEAAPAGAEPGAAARTEHPASGLPKPAQLGWEQRPWHPAQRLSSGQAAHAPLGATGWPRRGDPHRSPLPRDPVGGWADAL